MGCNTVIMGLLRRAPVLRRCNRQLLEGSHQVLGKTGSAENLLEVCILSKSRPVNVNTKKPRATYAHLPSNAMSAAPLESKRSAARTV